MKFIQILTNTFSENSSLLYISQKHLSYLYCNLDYLELYTHLRDVYKLGNENYNKLMKLKRNNRSLAIHNQQVGWIIEFYEHIQTLNQSSFLFPYCPVLNQQPLHVKDYELQAKQDLIKSCTSERKTDISAAYGEGLGYALLLSNPDISHLGVMKIANGNKSSPDFIVVNKTRKVVMLSEVKSTIHSNPGNPTEQLLDAKANDMGLGIQVKFNTGKTPIEILLSDPDYKMEGSIFPAIYTNISILQSVLKSKNDNNSQLDIKNKDLAVELREI